tara:strand:+ start:452 stop:1093 length:642 start_codon:yes stop_codon:yes gene_type:complete
MALKLFIDNDVMLKLARYGFLENLLELFTAQTEPVEVIVLDSARYKLLPRRNRHQLCGTEEVACQIECFLKKATVLSFDLVDTELVEILNASPGIDAGEALLFAGAARFEHARVLTGDKRALDGLAAQGGPEVTESLGGKVIVMEALMQGFAKLDHNQVQNAVRANPGVDKALTNIFGVSSPASLDSVHAGLESYKGLIRKTIGALINDGPPF